MFGNITEPIVIITQFNRFCTIDDWYSVYRRIPYTAILAQHLEVKLLK
jgi:hypothetical protein